MRSVLHRHVVWLFVGSVLVLWPASLLAATNAAPLPTAPRNIILMIGDGMGFEHVKAASLFSTGADGNIGFQSLPYTASMKTDSASIGVTESAASATAFATGHKVNNGVLSIAIPGDGHDLQTVLEYYKNLCKRTGLVTTTEITHATPAAFASHVRSRNDFAEIGRDYMQVKPNVLFGGSHPDFPASLAQAAGYTVVENREQLTSLDPHSVQYILGNFGLGHMAYEYDFVVGRTNFYEIFPHLSEMTSSALNILGAGENGFFLMVEGGRIDHTAHGKDLERTVFETLEFAKAVDVAIQWVTDHPDTLLVVTADHETGGLVVVNGKGVGEMPEVAWASADHTRKPVPVYAAGVGAESVKSQLDAPDIYTLLTKNSESREVACHTQVKSSPDQRLLIYSGFGLATILVLSLFLFLIYRGWATQPYQPRF